MNTVTHPIPPVFVQRLQDSDPRFLPVRQIQGRTFFLIIIRRTGSGRLWPESLRAQSPSPLMRKRNFSSPTILPSGM